ncbi:MAG: esterase-like activity of phytase family protein [Ilumatobacteraceae bacterium]
MVPGVVASAGARRVDREPQLVGRAVLPVETYAPGPPAGNFYTGPTNGITFPLPSQPVAGFSAIVEAQQPGEWLAMPDNGFGAKSNSADFLIRAYTLRIDFETAAGGSGGVQVGDYLSFRDPDRRIGFPIINENTTDRLLTGADIGPESLQVGRSGDLWVGDEFGPWILHFDATGRLLEAPIPLPGDLKSPSNPFLGGAAPTQPNSRGIEGMGISGRYLYPTLEGATVADATADPTRRLMFEYDARAGSFTGRQWVYRVDPATPFVSDIAPLDPNRLVVMERDGVNPGVQRRVYVVSLRDVGPAGSLVKRQVLDLGAVPDPDLISLPEIHPGDIGLGNPFRVLPRDRVLVGCDNNFPNEGRNPNRADDNEFIVVAVPKLSDR